MEKLKKRKIRESVMANYKKVVLSNSSCSCNDSACCETTEKNKLDNLSEALGYSVAELKNIPEGSNMGLGCGNPQAIASLQLGETVLDLGSGGGFDCFLASKSVGATGKQGIELPINGISLNKQQFRNFQMEVIEGKFNGHGIINPEYSEQNKNFIILKQNYKK